MKNYSRKAAFTLAEITVVLGVGSIALAGVMLFYVNCLKAGYAGTQDVKLLASMRQLTNELIYNGSRSHELILYPSAAASDRAAEDRLEVTNDESSSTADDICPTGDLAVFVYYELPKPAAQTKYRISSIIAYYLDTSVSGRPSLVRMTIDLSSAPSTETVETILTDNWSSAPRKTIASNVVPLALSDSATTSTVPQLFYRRANQNIAVCGQLRASGSSQDTADRRTYTRTFYFSVTIRS